MRDGLIAAVRLLAPPELLQLPRRFRCYATLGDPAFDSDDDE
jgi:hypothetical protein